MENEPNEISNTSSNIEPDLFGEEFFESIKITKNKYGYLNVRLICSESVECFNIIGENKKNEFFKLLKELRKL